MGCGEREYPKLVAVTTTPARCYGNRQISFQGQDGRRGSCLRLACNEGPQEEIAGLGTLGLSLLVSAAPLLSPPAC